MKRHYSPPPDYPKWIFGFFYARNTVKISVKIADDPKQIWKIFVYIIVLTIPVFIYYYFI